MASAKVPRRLSYRRPMRADSLHTLRRFIGRAWLGCLVLLLFASWRKGQLAPPEEMLPALRRAPAQEATARAPFEFPYRGRACRVRPVAEYELWGLVVSHNDIHSVADIYHDRSSVDTKDLCVVWGSNLSRSDYREVKFESGPFTCYFEFDQGVHFEISEASNNHLITDREEVRRSIARIKVGDQIHLRGELVDYQMDDWQDFWRQTSTIRQDSGCEVIYVETIEVLRRGTPVWYALATLASSGLLAGAAGWIVLFALEANRGTGSVGRISG
jgi:hypothetical protein